MSAEKTCTVCGVVQPLEAFSVRTAQRDGRASQCRTCDRERSRAYRLANPEKVKARLKRWQLDNKERRAEYMANWRKENADRVAIRDRAWRKANADQAHAKARVYYRENRERIAERRRAWGAANMERVVAASHQRREMMRRMTDTDREFIAILRADPCAYCGSTGGTIDHIEPLSAAGDLDWSNLTASCRKCNASKSTTSLLGFLRRRGIDREFATERTK